MISYLVDEKGKKTHAVVPIEVWEKCTAENKEISTKNSNITMLTIEDDCPNKQLNKLLPLIEGMETSSVEEWNDEYQQFFRYMHLLKYKDIELLYLIRSSEFINNLLHCTNEDRLDLFMVYYGIRKLTGQDITLEDCQKLRKALFNFDDEEFLKFFNSKYKLNVKEEKKIRIKAEINRLFIYDLMERFPKCMELDYDITVKEAQKKLMKFLYNNSKGAKTQVQRALRQASSSIMD